MKALRRALSFLRHLLLHGLFAVYLSPFFLVLINSFKSRREILSNPFGLPPAWSLQNFTTAFQRMGDQASRTVTAIRSQAAISFTHVRVISAESRRLRVQP